jgi:hypothetical protein
MTTCGISSPSFIAAKLMQLLSAIDNPTDKVLVNGSDVKFVMTHIDYNSDMHL